MRGVPKNQDMDAMDSEFSFTPAKESGKNMKRNKSEGNLG